MRDDFISIDKPKKDRVIREMYTPKEVVKIIRDIYKFMIDIGLTQSEKALLREVFNTLIWEFKDD